MDPTANLMEQLVLASEIQRVWDECGIDGALTIQDQEYVSEKANRMAELVVALNVWMQKGGALPAQWKR